MTTTPGGNSAARPYLEQLTMAIFEFKCPATETLHGTAFFSVEAATEAEARAKLTDDASEFFDNFSEYDGRVEWEAKAAGDWELYA